MNNVQIETVNINCINITWETIDFNDEKIKEIKINKINFGFYQIYGHHPAYGKDALLYIGQASDFFTRLNKRFEFLESCATPTSIKLGRITTSRKSIDESNVNTPFCDFDRNELINTIETILIKTHTPAFNKTHNSSMFSKEGINNKHYIILNWEDFGDLLPEISTLRFSHRFWLHDKPLEW